MSKLLSATGRWCAIFGLWPLIAVTLPLSWALGETASAALSIATWARRTEKRLRLGVGPANK